jgi:hypothetical protein
VTPTMLLDKEISVNFPGLYGEKNDKYGQITTEIRLQIATVNFPP